MKTRRSIECEIQFAADMIAAEPEDTINRLRYCFPDLDDKDLLAMALRHPTVARIVRRYTRRLRRHERELTAWHDARRKTTQAPNRGGKVERR
jgi:hypothetical protein